MDGYCRLHHPSTKNVQNELAKVSDALKHIDTMQGLRDSIKFYDPMKEYREALKHIDTMKNIRESMITYDPMEEYREALKHIDTMKGLRDSIKFLDPMKEYREALKHLDIMKGLRDSMRYNPMKEYRKAIEHIHTMKGLQDSISSILPNSLKTALDATNLLKPFSNIHQQIKSLQDTINAKSIGRLVNSFQEMQKQTGIANFGAEPIINADGTLSISLDTVDLEKLHNAGTEVISHVENNESENIVEAIEKLIVEVKSLKEPLIQRMLIQLIFPLILTLVFAFFNPVADFYVKEHLNKAEKKQVSNHINKEVVNNIRAKEVLRHLRYVKADVLCVRKDKSSCGKLIGYLYFGQVVEIKEKRKNWTRIKWVDETGEISIEGWVFTRYLKKFN